MSKFIVNLYFDSYSVFIIVQRDNLMWDFFPPLEEVS